MLCPALRCTLHWAIPTAAFPATLLALLALVFNPPLLLLVISLLLLFHSAATTTHDNLALVSGVANQASCTRAEGTTHGAKTEPDEALEKQRAQQRQHRNAPAIVV
jgi:hypothetical protein